MPGSSSNVGYGNQQQINQNHHNNNLSSSNLNQNNQQQQFNQQQHNQQQNNQQQQFNNFNQQPQVNINNFSQEMQALFMNPQFQQIKNEINRNPHMLQYILEQIRNSNPTLFNLINSHQEEFIALLNIPSNDPIQNMVNMYNQSHGNQQQYQQRPRLVLTPEDEPSINELMALTGFGRDKCVKGYLACGKNTDLAAS